MARLKPWIQEIKYCLILIIAIVLPQHVNSGSIEGMEYTLNLIQEGEKIISIGKYDEIVLVLGNSGAGKSTFTQFIAGDNTKLISKEVGEGTGEFIIEDLNDKISNNSTIVSKTIFPELVIEEKTNTAFYDCPGFSDTRNSSIDIAATYFIHKVIESAKSIKTVFVVNHNSLKEGVDRADFMKLLKHAVSFFKNIQRFNESITLVATKVDNTYVKNGKNLELVPDNKIINNIGNFLDNVKGSIIQILQDTPNTPKREFYENAIKMIDIIMVKNNENYTKINLFRRPDEPGFLSDIELLQDGKKSIEKMLHNNVNYAEINKGDFGYSISEESINEIAELVEQINVRLIEFMEKVQKKVLKFFVTEESNSKDIYSLKDQFKNGYEVMSHLSEKSSNIEKPLQLVDNVIASTSELKISISKELFETVLRYDKFLNFLEEITGKKFKLKPLEWIKPLENVIRFLRDSKNIYNFYMEMFSKLSDYSIQKDTGKFDVIGLKQKILAQIQNNQTVPGNILETFLRQIYQEDIEHGSTIHGFDDIRNVEIDQNKREFLYDMLETTLSFKNSKSCSNLNKLQVKGNYVKLSEILDKSACTQDVKAIEIFALTKVFIDTDLIETGKKLQLVIIAPTWEIIGDKRTINLNGIEGQAFSGKANDGITPNYGGINGRDGGKGENGKPGAAGITGGSFFAVGKTFINAKNLLVMANGGKGGRGQDAGNGGNAEPGKDVDWVYLWEDVLVTIGYNYGIKYYEQKGGNGGHGGNGGDGGAEGNPGQPGKVSLISVGKYPSEITIEMKSGAEGKPGVGGTGGNQAHSGYFCTGEWATKFILFIPYVIGWQNVKCHQIKYEDGRSGNGTNYEGRENDTIVDIRDKSIIFNNFKSFVTSNLNDHFNRVDLTVFLTDLDNNNEIWNFYDIHGLTNELLNLESQFFKVDGKISYLPLYQSLSNRILKYSENSDGNKISLEEKKVLGYLYSATLSKICSFKLKLENNLIIDIKEYLNYAIDNIKKLEKTSNKVLVDEYNKQYKAKVDQKIEEGNFLINSHIMPELNHVNSELSGKISLLLDELILLENEAEVEKQVLYKKRYEVVKAGKLKILSEILGGIGMVASFLGPYGAAAGKVFEAGSSITKSLALDDISNLPKVNIPKGVLDLLKSTDDFIKKSNQEKLEVIEHQSAKLAEAISLYPEYLSDVQTEIATIRNNDNFDSDEKLRLIQLVIDNKLMKLSDNGILLIDTEKETEEEKEKKSAATKILEGLQNIYKVSKFAFGVYKQYKDNQSKLDEINKAIDNMDANIDQLKQYQTNIEKIYKPFLKQMWTDLNSVIFNLTSSSLISLDVTKWKVQSSLKDIKFQMKQITEGFEVQENLLFSIGKIDDAMDVIINVYDRIQVYNEQKTMADNIANIASAKSNIVISDPELNSAVNKIELVMKSNTVLSNYESAISGLKQFIFPFAEFYLQEFKLPTSLRTDENLQNLIATAVNQIETLKSKLVKSESTINNKHDQYLHHGNFDSNSKISQPFYIWHNEEHRSIITDLLAGKEVILKADVMQSSSKNAIKFTEIDLQFKTKNEIFQNDFNEIMENLEINITHFGISEYRCDDKFFIISSESQAIRYSFARNSNGEPVNKNVVYEKLKTSDFMLSPYTLWSIKLMSTTDFDFYKLHDYNNQISLELSGYGQYVYADADICSENLENYYRSDNTVY